VPERLPAKPQPAGPATLDLGAEVVAKRNRRWLLTVILPGLIISAASLAAAVIASQSQTHVVAPLSVPQGYKPISDGYFAYSVPANWQQANAYTDDVGDLAYEGSEGFVAEHVGARLAAPQPGEPAPASFAAFGEPRPTPYHLGAASPYEVVGATVAYRYEMTRPGGFEAITIDTWRSASDAELWLLIDAPLQVRQTILSTLRAG
jgi:hypothetical protein